MTKQTNYIIAGIAAVVAVAGIMFVTGSDLSTSLPVMAPSTNPVEIIANMDCDSAAKLSYENMRDTTTREQLGIIALLGDCIRAGDVSSESETRDIMKAMSGDITYSWPESVGNTPVEPIMLPFTLDESYTSSDLGIGGCEITISGISTVSGQFSDRHYLDMKITPVRDVEYCEFNGWDTIREQHEKDGNRAILTKNSIIEGGDILIGVRVNTNVGNQDDTLTNTVLGLIGGVGRDNVRTYEIRNDPNRYSAPYWNFAESDDIVSWEPGVDLPNSHSATTGWDLFGGYQFTKYDRYPVNIEFIFAGMDKLDNVDGDTVWIRDQAIQYSKYFTVN